MTIAVNRNLSNCEKPERLVEHCSANAEATGSNPVEVPKSFFRAFSQLLKLRFTVMVTYSFQNHNDSKCDYLTRTCSNYN